MSGDLDLRVTPPPTTEREARRRRIGGYELLAAVLALAADRVISIDTPEQPYEA